MKKAYHVLLTFLLISGFCINQASTQTWTPRLLPKNICLPGETGEETLYFENPAVRGLPVYPITVNWSTGQSFTITDPAVQENTITGLSAGTYMVTVTDATATSRQIGGPLFDISANPITGTTSSTAATDCYSADGTATGQGAGGLGFTQLFGYQWSNGFSGQNATNLTGGDYTVTVSGFITGCTTTVDVAVPVTNNNSGLVINSISATDEVCGDGSGTATVSASASGSGSLTYLWSNGATTATATGLSAGNYTVTVTLAGCSVTDNVDVFDNTSNCGPLTATVSATPSSCNVNNGTATAVPSGGFPNIPPTIPGIPSGYNITWSNGFSGANATNLAPGTYTVTVGDQNSNTIVLTVDVDEDIELTASATDEICGDGSGTATVAATSAAGGNTYTYLWSNGATTASISGLSAGTYTVTVTSSNGCTATESVQVLDDTSNCTSPFTATVSATPSSCNVNNGTATAVPSGGFPNIPPTIPGIPSGYNITWSNGFSGANATNLAPGTYTVTVGDQNSNTIVLTVDVDEDIELTASATDEICGDGSGTATVAATSAAGGNTYTYLWSNGATTASISGLSAGTYSVTVTSSNGCTATESVQVLDDTSNCTSPFTATVSATPSSCNVNNGTATAVPSGGFPNIPPTIPGVPSGYNITWSNGFSGANATNLAPGTYTVTVGDQNSNTIVLTVDVDEDIELTASATDEICGDGSGTATVAATSAAGGNTYTYLWSNGATTASISGLSAGTYTVTVASSNGCTATESVQVLDDTSNCTSPFTATVSATPSSCNVNNGTATAVPSGGFPNIPPTIPGIPSGYNITWSNGFSGANATNLAPGTYTVTVGDQNSNTIVLTVDVDEDIELTASATDEICGDGSGTATVAATSAAGGNTYTYLWSNGATTASISGLSAGTYSVTVTSSNGCTATESVQVLDDTSNCTSPFTATVSATPSSCNVNNGTATAVPSGGFPNIPPTIPGVPSGYNITWSNGFSGANATNLAPGTYTVTVGDQNSNTIVLTVDVDEDIELTASATDEICGDGSGTATVAATSAAGGNTYTYLWSNGATTASISGLSAGTYSVTVTSSNGCTATESVQVLDDTSNCTSPFTATVSATPSSCNVNNGTATAVPSGGFPNIPPTIPGIPSGYNITWSNGFSGANATNLAPGTYTVTVGDQNSNTIVLTVDVDEDIELTASATDEICGNDGTASVTATSAAGGNTYTYLWSTGATTASISGLAAGTYDVTVTSSNGCQTTESVQVSGSTSSLTVNVTGTDDSCEEGVGSASASISGATGAVTYTWSNGDSGSSISNLTAGTYTVNVVDGSGCTASGSVTIGTTPAVAVSAIAASTTCGLNNGTASASVSGGTAGFTYAWSNGDNGASISNLSAGDYTVVVTDANNCTASTTVTVGGSSAISVSVTGIDDSCEEGVGSASASVSGATGTVTYTWSNGDSGSSTSGLTAGTYTVNVVDGNGCTASGSVTIGTTPAVMVSATATDEACDSSNGTATASASGGTAAFSYAWSNGDSGSSISGLTGGTYDVTVTDANGCTASASVTVGTTPAVSVSATATSTTCGLNNGSASASVSGGTAGFTYAWSNGDSGASISNLSAGDYTVVVTDANNCTTSTTVTVGDSDPISVSVTGSDDSCEEGVGSASASVSGATGTVTYTWSNGDSGSSTSGLTAGTYTVNVVDGNGCTASGSVTIGTTPAVMVSATATDEACDSSNGTATASASGGTAAFSYAWSNGDSGSSISGLTGGTYDVTVTDANGCTASASVTVGTTPAVSVSATAASTTCGLNNGTASATASGGTAGFTYAWSNGDSGASISNLSAGDYTVVVTDANNCTASTTVTVGGSSAISVSVTGIDDSCEEGVGSASASVSGATGTVTYTWSNGDSGSSTSGLTAGTYTVNVVDSNGCTASGSVTIGTTPAVMVSATATDEACDSSNGTATALASGGTAAFSYAWSNGDSGSSISGLTGGTYDVTVTDGNGCTASASVTVGTTPAVSVSATAVDASCDLSNGSAIASTSGGTAGFTYAWSNGDSGAMISNVPGGTYTVTVTDANGCTASASVTVGTTPAVSVSATAVDASCDLSNGSATASASGGTAGFTYAWSNGDSGAMISNVPGGTYTVTVTDANGCTASASVTVGTTPAVSVSATAVDASCDLSNGSATASASGGTAGFTYAWSNGDTGAMISNVPGGTYTVTVTDANGCTASASVTVGTTPAVSVSATAVDASCDLSNGSATASASGGTAGFTYAWSNGETTATISGLPAGTYDVTVTDANGCTASASVTLNTTPAVTGTINSTGVTCFGADDGTATATIATGTAPFTYAWSNGDTGSSISGLSAGTYDVTVTDANGCTATGTIPVNGPDNDTSDEWIESIDLADLWNTSGDDGGYGDYCSLTANVTTGDSYTMTLTPGYSGIAYKEYWRVYIDFNQDGVFSHPSERVLQRSGKYTRTGTVHIPNNAMAGTTKMRVVMRYGGYGLPCSSGFYGEVEDYTINITVCDNVTDGGTIEADETLCPGMDDPAAITNVTLPSGGTGALEYVWLMNTTTSNPPPAAGWTTIANSDAPTYDPGVISQTTWYIRCARRAGCSEYWGESNVIEKTFNPSCNGPSYCNSKGLNTNYEWIKRVKLKTVNNLSNNDGGYGDYTNLVINMNPGESKTISMWPGFSGSSYREYWRVWVDWNQDGDFDDAGELEGQGNGFGKITKTVSVPNNAAPGQTRMRVSMRYGWYANPCQTFAEGEVEDYTINVSGGGNRQQGSNDQLELVVAQSFDEVDLTWVNNTGYKNDLFVIEKSADGTNFTPIGEQSSLDSEQGEVYRDKDVSPHAGANFYRIKLILDDNTTMYSNMQAIEITLETDEFTVFPNPASDQVYVSMKNMAGRPGSVTMSDKMGRVIFVKTFDSIPTHAERFELKGYSPGVYFISVRAEGRRMITKRLVIIDEN